MDLSMDDQVLMGMDIESVRIQEGNFEILTPGAQVTLRADGILNIQQRIGAERELLSCTQTTSRSAPARSICLSWMPTPILY